MSKSQPKNDANVRPVGNPLWYKGMPVSPHPAGRPKGLSTTTKLMQRMMEDADGVVDAIVAKALEGDTGAASLIISRILPTIRNQTEKVQFDFDAAAPIALQVEQVLSAISRGEVAADVGKQIIDAIGALAQVRAAEELEERISKLEERQA
tara:strand:+ start:1768 stop:2220 length:453 start_codon:yes stop_codon:yes gene_type:complete